MKDAGGRMWNLVRGVCCGVECMLSRKGPLLVMSDVCSDLVVGNWIKEFPQGYLKIRQLSNNATNAIVDEAIFKAREYWYLLLKVLTV